MWYCYVFRLGPEVLRKNIFEAAEQPSQDKYQDVTWYHNGPESLEIARKWLAGELLFVHLFFKH